MGCNGCAPALLYHIDFSVSTFVISCKLGVLKRSADPHSQISLLLQDSGTTATVIIICGKDIVTANVGDSLAFLDCGSGVHQLSGNHRIDDNASERQRLEAAGGEVSQSQVDGHACGPLRVWPGGLAMSRYTSVFRFTITSLKPFQIECLHMTWLRLLVSCRTIGDRHAGSRVTAKPFVSQICVGPAGARITLASDGLWDAFNNNGKTVCHRIRELQYTKAAARLRSAAKAKRDRDDITVICCDMLPDASIRIPPALFVRKEHELQQVRTALDGCEFTKVQKFGQVLLCPS